jgi:hypothetical protein
MYYGWVEDRIRYLIEDNWHVFYELPWCLVTCIDSTKDVKSMMKEVIEVDEFCSFLGSGLIVGNGRILAREYNLFYGFDEIWLYKDCPTVEKPEGVTIVSTRDLSKEDPSKELLEWFKASGCVLGLGDGIGMNYLTTSKEIVESLNIRQQEFDSEVEGRSNEGGASKE